MSVDPAVAAASVSVNAVQDTRATALAAVRWTRLLSEDMGAVSLPIQ